ncbi:hypothetical protein [Arthrobacter sp. CAN_A214]
MEDAADASVSTLQCTTLGVGQARIVAYSDPDAAAVTVQLG